MEVVHLANKLYICTKLQQSGMNLSTLRMMLAALKQMLRDRSNKMPQKEIIDILDRISVIQKVIDELEGE